MKALLFITILACGQLAWASSTVIKTFDTIKATGGSSLSVPSTGTAFATDSNTLTFTNKSIDGSTNTLTKLPVGASLVQEIPTGSVNGSNTSFTLSFAPVSVASLVVQLDGLALIQGSGKDYTISGSTITMATAPAAGQSIFVTYSRY